MRNAVLNTSRLYESLRQTRPQTKQDLKNYVKVFLGIDVPGKTICPGHCSPLDYLWHSFNTDFEPSTIEQYPYHYEHNVHHCHSERVQYPVILNKAPSPVILNEAQRSEESLVFDKGDSSATPQNDKRQATSNERRINADAIVWANRAGGKTELAAVATLLECIFKPNCKTRILAGSGEQSFRMYEYFLTFLKNGFEKFLAAPPQKEKCTFLNGSNVEVLTQSPASIRGQHIHKLRCDELELFTEEVFNAAKFTTQSTHNILAAMEVISTMHRPYGLMQKLVTDAQTSNVPIFKWCVWKTIEKCTDRNCSRCPLWPDCHGRAKHAQGYLKIDDVITQMRRSSRAGFEAEMLCLRPSLENAVFAEFDPAVHVKQIDYEPSLPLYRSLDFGYVNPFVCLWIQIDPAGNVRIIDEYIRSRATIDAHAREIVARTPCNEANVAATFCDPAGAGVNDVTGTSAVRELRARNIKVRYRRSSILEGIELIRRAIKTGDGRSKLIISPRCTKLIEATALLPLPRFSHARRAAPKGRPIRPPNRRPAILLHKPPPPKTNPYPPILNAIHI